MLFKYNYINIFYFYIKVLDPRLKLQYYQINEWEEEYINTAKTTVTEIWNNFYKNSSSVIEESDETDELLDHVFKKQKTEVNDELKIYLKEEVANRSVDVLLWWKV